MRWKEFKPSEIITWEPISVSRKGIYSPTASFDIAIVEGGDKIVIFRNQTILFDKKQDDLKKLAKDHLENALNLKTVSVSDALDIRPAGGGFTGALNYSLLAGDANLTNTGENLQILPAESFTTKRAEEDDF